MCVAFSYLLSELPRKKRMMFLCGVEVEVSFSALYSNVLVAFATIKTTGPRTQDCTVTLSSLPVNICFTLNYHPVKFYCHLYRNYKRSIKGHSCTKALLIVTQTDNKQTIGKKFTYTELSPFHISA